MQDKMSGVWEVLTNGSYHYPEATSRLHGSAFQDPPAFGQHTPTQSLLTPCQADLPESVLIPLQIKKNPC